MGLVWVKLTSRANGSRPDTNDRFADPLRSSPRFFQTPNFRLIVIGSSHQCNKFMEYTCLVNLTSGFPHPDIVLRIIVEINLDLVEIRCLQLVEIRT